MMKGPDAVLHTAPATPGSILKLMCRSSIRYLWYYFIKVSPKRHALRDSKNQISFLCWAAEQFNFRPKL